jgi:hypothetical protein
VQSIAVKPRTAWLRRGPAGAAAPRDPAPLALARRVLPGSSLRAQEGISKMPMAMKALKAHVRGGRLVLDEPTDLPEGAEVRVALVDDDDLDDAERARLHAAITEAETELEAGKGAGEDELWSRLRTPR